MKKIITLLLALTVVFTFSFSTITASAATKIGNTEIISLKSEVKDATRRLTVEVKEASNATSYDVYYKKTSETKWSKKVIEDGTKLTFKVGNEAATYQVKVRGCAWDYDEYELATGKWSGTKKISVSKVTTLNKVKITKTKKSWNYVKLYWNKVKNAKKYEVRYKYFSTKKGKWLWKSVYTTKTYKKLKGLFPDYGYEIKVRAVKGSTKGKWAKKFVVTKKRYYPTSRTYDLGHPENWVNGAKYNGFKKGVTYKFKHPRTDRIIKLTSKLSTSIMIWEDANSSKGWHIDFNGYNKTNNEWVNFAVKDNKHVYFLSRRDFIEDWTGDYDYKKAGLYFLSFGTWHPAYSVAGTKYSIASAFACKLYKDRYTCSWSIDGSKPEINQKDKYDEKGNHLRGSFGVDDGHHIFTGYSMSTLPTLRTWVKIYDKKNDNKVVLDYVIHEPKELDYTSFPTPTNPALVDAIPPCDWE